MFYKIPFPNLLQGIRTNAKRDGDDWIINGSKIYITNGWLTDCCIVVAKTKPDAKRAAHGISLFLVDADTKGFHKGKKLKGIKSAFFIGTPSTYKKGSVHLLHCCINGKSHVIICIMKRELDLHSWFNPSASKKYIL